MILRLYCTIQCYMILIDMNETAQWLNILISEVKYCQSYVEVDGVRERIDELQNDAGKEDDKHDDRPHPLPHDHPDELHVPGDGLRQLSEESAQN